MEHLRHLLQLTVLMSVLVGFPSPAVADISVDPGGDPGLPGVVVRA